MPTLSTRVLDSLGWVFSNIVAKNLIQLVRMWALWKILAPRDFGLNQMAWLAINMFTFLQDMGFSAALVQRKKDIEAAVSIVWYTNVGIRLIVYLLLFAVAPLVAEHFREPLVSPILRVAGLCILISSFGNANEQLLKKNFQFRTIAVIDTLDILVQTVAQIVFALLGFGVWSLVYGSLTSAVGRSLSFWVFAPIRVGRFDFRVAREMFHFAKHMTLSTVLIWLIMHMDNYFVGKFFGAAALGYYTLAFTMAHIIATNVARLLGSVLFPAFAEIGADVDRVRGAWLRAARYTMVVLCPMGVGLMVFAPELVRAFFPKAWHQALIVPIAVLAVFALCRGLGATLGDLSKGIGKPGILTRVAFAHAALMFPLLLAVSASVGPAISAALGLGSVPALATVVGQVLFFPVILQVGLVWVSAVVSGTAFFAMGLSFYWNAREVRFTAREVLQALRPSVTAALAMAAAGWAGKTLLGAIAPGAHPLVLLAGGGTLAVAVYAAVLWFGFPEVTAHLQGLLARRHGERKAAAEEKEKARV